MKAKKKLIAKRQKGTRADREHAKRFAANVSTGILIVGGIIGLVMLANKWSKREELRNFRIVGRKILDSAEVMKQAAVPDSLPFAKLNLAEIEHRVESHPFISGAPYWNGALDRALAYVTGKPGVWRATGSEIIEHYVRQVPDQ